MSKEIEIKYTVLEEGINDPPIYKTPGAAGADICSRIDECIYPGKVMVIPTGLKVEIPDGYELQVRPRSGLAVNNCIGVLNSPGTIDSDYRGELNVILYNASPNKNFFIHKGDRIAQIVLSEVPRAKFTKSEELSETVRGEGKFGSTGVES